MKTLYLYLKHSYFFLVFLLISCSNTKEQKIDKFDEIPVRIVINIDRQYISDENCIANCGMIRSEELRTFMAYHSIRQLTAVYRNRYNNEGKLKPNDRISYTDEDNWFFIDHTGRTKAKDMVKQLVDMEGVAMAYIEEPIWLTPCQTNNYPFTFTNQWHLTRNQGINVEDAWSINRGRNDVIIAVCDGGVDYTHSNLDPGDRSRIIAGYDTGDGDNNPMDDLPDNHPDSYAGHGTHVAGIIGANPAGTNRISGVMQNCKIMPVKMVGSGGVVIKMPFKTITAWDFSTTAFPSDVADAIDYAVNNGAYVINLSYGFSTPGFPIDEVIFRVPLLYRSINNAYQNNVVIVAAMGNEGNSGSPVQYPAAFSDVIAVGNTTSARTRASSSSIGSHISIAAPGSNILSTLRGGAIGTKSGTSMAAPVVSGLAGLIISQGKDRNFNLTNDDVRQILERTADDVGTVGFDNEYGHGIVNAFNALSLLAPPNTLIHGESVGGTATKLRTLSKWSYTGSRWNLAPGMYLSVDQYEIRKHISFPQRFISPPQVWMRERESVTMSFASPNEGRPYVEITNITNEGFDVRYAAYYVPWNTISQAINKWVPSNSNSTKLAYTAVGIIAPTISGPSLVCSGSSATFTIQNWQNNQTIEWTPGPYLTRTGESGNQATFAANGNGASWIDATVNGVQLARYNLWVGAPIITSVDGPTETKVNNIEMYTCVVSSGSTVTWSVSPNNNFSFWSVYGRTAQIYFHTSRLYQVNAQASNTCGSVTSSKNANVRPCPTCGVVIMSIYPNPASNILNIEINPQTLAQAKTLEQTTTGAKQLKTDPTYDIRLYDYQGNLLRQQKTKGGTVQFNVANFTNGIYYLHIYDGINEKPEMRQIVVEH